MTPRGLAFQFLGSFMPAGPVMQCYMYMTKFSEPPPLSTAHHHRVALDAQFQCRDGGFWRIEHIMLANRLKFHGRGIVQTTFQKLKRHRLSNGDDATSFPSNIP